MHPIKTLPSALQAGEPKSRRLMLILDDLAQRGAEADSRRCAMVFGGTEWFVRVWKRLALRARRQGWVLWRVLVAAVRIAVRTVVPPPVARLSIFRAASLAFRF